MTDTPIVHATVRQWGTSQYVPVPHSLAAVGDDVTIVRGTAPEGLARVLDALPDGCELRRLCDVPEGWEWQCIGGGWLPATADEFDRTGLVVCRPVPDPQPRTEKVPWWKALGRKDVNGRPIIRVQANYATRPTYTIAGDGQYPVLVDDAIDVLVEDDPADTDTCYLCGTPNGSCECCALCEKTPCECTEPVSSGRVPTEGDDTTGRNELTPQERLLADASRDAAILRHIATSADDLNTPDDGAVAGHLRSAARTTERLAGLVRDAKEPKPIELVEELHRAVFGDSWARPETPKAVWDDLLARVEALAVAAQPLPDADQRVEKWLYNGGYMSPGDYTFTPEQLKRFVLDAVAAIRQADAGSAE